MLKQIIKTSIITSLCLSTLNACNGGSTAQSPRQNAPATSLQLGSLDNLSASSLGAPAINADGETAILAGMSSCATFPEKAKIHNSTGGGGTSYGFQKNLSSEDILSAMGVDASLKGQINTVSGDFAAEYEKINKASQLEYRFSYLTKDERRFDLDGSVLVKKGSNGGLKECGTGFISGGNGGIYFEGSLIVKFKSLKDKEALVASGALSAGDLAQLAGKLKMAKEQDNIQFDVLVEIAQRGGDSSKILTIFKNLKLKDEANTFYLANLSTDNMETAANALQDYIETDLQDQLKELPELNSVEDVRKKVFLTNKLLYSKYSNSEDSFDRSSALVNAINVSNNKFATLNSFSQKYNKFIKTTSSFSDRPNVFDSVRKANDFSNEIAVIKNDLASSAKKCYGFIESSMDENCVQELNSISEKVGTLLQNINATNWDSGYKIYSSGSVVEALLPISDNEFVTYANDMAKSIYLPGSLYSKSTDNTIEPIDLDFAFDSESFIQQSYVFKYNITSYNVDYTGKAFYLDPDTFESAAKKPSVTKQLKNLTKLKIIE